MNVIRPFGPTIAKVSMSENLVKELNDYVDKFVVAESLYTHSGNRKKPNFIPEAVRMVLFGPGVTYITKLYALIAKINSQVIIKFSRESLQTV